MKQPTRTDSEYLEHLNFLGAIFYVSFGLVLALMAFWSIYPKLIVIGILLSLLGPTAFWLFVYIVWKNLSVWRFSRRAFFTGSRRLGEGDGFMEMVIQQAMSNAFLVTLVALTLLYGLSINRTGEDALPVNFCLLVVGALLTSSYGASYLVLFKIKLGCTGSRR